MMQINDNMPRQKGKHLTRDERIQIKVLNQKGDSNRAIAQAIGCHRQTVKNELDRGSVSQVKAQKQNGKTYRYTHTVYFPDAGQRQYEANRLNCGSMPKWVSIPAFMEWADTKMLEDGWSPDAVIGYLKTHFPYATALLPCTTTLYHWIHIGMMRTKNIDLLEKVSRAPRKTGRHVKKTNVSWALPLKTGRNILKTGQNLDTGKLIRYWASKAKMMPFT